MSLVSIRILFICGLLIADVAHMQTIVLGQSSTGNTAQATAANAPHRRSITASFSQQGSADYRALHKYSEFGE
jgi:hypothetical protein